MDIKFNHQNKAELIRNNVNKVIIGKENVIDIVLASLLAGGHVLLEDVPGTGKTMLAKSFAKSIDVKFNRIQFTPDLLPSDITGINYFNQKQGEFVFREGPLFSNIILADEINRATPRTQSALLEAMEERQITVDTKTTLLSKPFMVIATENPIETAGTYQLPEAQLDRFLVKISMGYPDEKQELDIINRFLSENPLEQLESVCSADDISEMQTEVKNVYVHKSIMEYVIAIASKTRNYASISIGVSPRGTINMINVLRAYAYINQRSYVVPEDVKALAEAVFGHRLVLNSGVARHNNRADVIKNILDEVEVPTEDWNR